MPLLKVCLFTETPQPTENCPRKNGYFAHEKRNICDKFYYCVDGKYNMITCPNGLVYNENAGICSWPDEAKRGGCTSEGKQKIQLCNTKIINAYIGKFNLYFFHSFLIYLPEVFQFECPKVDEQVGLTHPRYADPDDCQYFYVCINGNVPRRNGCKLGQVFDDQSKKCEWARLVPEWCVFIIIKLF